MQEGRPVSSVTSKSGGGGTPGNQQPARWFCWDERE